MLALGYWMSLYSLFLQIRITDSCMVHPSVPSEVVEKLHTVDIETLTPLEALNFLYELKNTLDKD